MQMQNNRSWALVCVCVGFFSAVSWDLHPVWLLTVVVRFRETLEPVMRLFRVLPGKNSPRDPLPPSSVKWSTESIHRLASAASLLSPSRLPKRESLAPNEYGQTDYYYDYSLWYLISIWFDSILKYLFIQAILMWGSLNHDPYSVM